ncbi:MAG: hypothetical protein E7170_03615 [Firmicutes bacterium]|nr:hypothetical protein [Bacillota bacterium]
MKNKKKLIIFIVILIVLIFITLILKKIKNEPVIEYEGKKVTATFVKTGLNYIESDSISCYIKPKNNSCEIKLPIYNVEGSYNLFWSIEELPETDLTDYEWESKYFYGVGSTYELTKDTTFYPNTNAFHFDWANEENQNYEPHYKYRKLDIVKSEKIGNTIFEFENGIPENYINQYINEVKQVYTEIPWIFVPAKVFALTEETYNSYSIAYGLTQDFYTQDYEPWTTSISVIDVQYDTTGILSEEIEPNSISMNATIHELAHAWDSYYRFCNRSTEPKLISETTEVKELYNNIKDSGTLYNDGNEYISEIEFFAGMVTNYYWHILDKGPNKPYYALQQNKKMTVNQKEDLKKIIEKYALEIKN